MSGEYIGGEASILTEPGIGTGQTPVSTEHVDDEVSVEFFGAFGAESTQPAVIRSRERVIRMQTYVHFRNDGFVFVSRIFIPPQAGLKESEDFQVRFLVISVGSHALKVIHCEARGFATNRNC
jgi:hypothetical protein